MLGLAWEDVDLPREQAWIGCRLPVERLVLLNAMIPAPGESGHDWWVNTGQDAARRELDPLEGRSPDAPFDPLVYFFHDVPAVVLSCIRQLSELRRADRLAGCASCTCCSGVSAPWSVEQVAG